MEIKSVITRMRAELAYQKSRPRRKRDPIILKDGEASIINSIYDGIAVQSRGQWDGEAYNGLYYSIKPNDFLRASKILDAYCRKNPTN